MSSIGIALTQLARVRDPRSRAALAIGVTDICVAKPLTNRIEPLANDILLSLANKVEESVRIQMASRLADCDWAPRGIVRYLAFDAPSVAASVIARSQVLDADDLIELAEKGSRAHRVMIAERHHIGIAVTDAVADRSEIDVLEALSANATARMSTGTLEKCMDAAEQAPGISTNLLDRDDLPAALVERLTDEISAAVRTQVEAHFGLSHGALDHVGTRTAARETSHDEDKDARELVSRMSAAGELNGTVAVHAIAEGKIVLFDHAIADLCGVSADQWRTAVGISSVRATALACRAARIDKNLFPAVLRGMQRAGRVQPDLPPDAMVSAATVFQKYTPGSAYDALRRLAPSD
jgi:uncharacterized protein (DUF2336 family)